jgi:hypothetical protein
MAISLGQAQGGNEEEAGAWKRLVCPLSGVSGSRSIARALVIKSSPLPSLIHVTNTYSLLSSTVSACRKSTATIPAAWACRNCRHVGPRRRGAGSMPAARRISHTVDGATLTPSFVSSPWIRRCPHSGFSVASRTTRRAMPGTVGGRPGLRRLFAVPGQECRGRDGEGLGPAPAGYQRCQRGEPRPVGRLVPHPAGLSASTAFSCRSTSSSASLAGLPRNNRTTRPSTRRVST